MKTLLKWGVYLQTLLIKFTTKLANKFTILTRFNTVNQRKISHDELQARLVKRKPQGSINDIDYLTVNQSIK